MRPEFTRSVTLILCLLCLIPDIYAGSWDDKLKDALKEYVEDEVDKATETLAGDNKKEEKPKTVQLKFAGAEPVLVELFTPLSEPERSATDLSTLPAVANSDPERACFDLVQGKVAWNQSGSKSWSPNNINRLCAGTVKAAEPVNCFKYVMFSGSQWGQTSAHNVTWSEATNLCAGTSDANSVTTCFKNKIKAGQSLGSAIAACKTGTSKTAVTGAVVNNTAVIAALNTHALGAANTANKEDACYNYVQGKIAWDNAGKNTTWGAGNVKRLCKGTTSEFSPGNCFKYVMFSGSSWGKRPSDNVGWQQAIDLCEGISNNQETTGCFKNNIGSGKSLDAAIKQCEKK